MNDSVNGEGQDTSPVESPLPTEPRVGRRRWVSLMLGLVIFASGIVIGAAGAAVVIRREILHVLRDPGAVPARITKQLTRRLSLTAAQAGRVQDILEARQRSLRAIRVTIQPDILKQLLLAKAEVAAVLDEEQRERWEADFDRLSAIWIPPLPAETRE